MAIERSLLRAIRRLDEYELRRLLIVVRGLLLHADGPPQDEIGLPPTLTYRQEAVRCGKDSCTTCPHGPYWYGYWKENGRTRKRYIGRHLPGEELLPVVPRDATSSGPDDGPAPEPSPEPSPDRSPDRSPDPFPGSRPR